MNDALYDIVPRMKAVLRINDLENSRLLAVINHIINRMSEEVQPHVLQLYQLVKKIGSGAYGHVWKVIDRQTKTIKALKKNFDAFANSTDAQRTYREVMFLRQLKHPNIISLEKTIRARNDKDIYLVFEHMDVDLHTLIRENGRSTHLEERHKQYIIHQIAKSIYYLHNSNLIHRDLKPSNVLINQNCEAKLCDFGLVRLMEEPDEQETVVMTDYIATRWYRAPQLLLGCRDYTKSVDIWALGCLIGEMFLGKAMFPGTSTINQIQKVVAWTGSPTPNQTKHISGKLNQAAWQLLTTRKKLNRNDFFGPKISTSCLDLIGRMLEFDPAKRIGIQQVLKHDYLKQFFNEKEMKEMSSSRAKIQLHINDNTKLSVKDYRELIYSQIVPKQKMSIVESSISSITSSIGGSFKSKRSQGKPENNRKEASKQKARVKTYAHQINENIEPLLASKSQTTYQSLANDANGGQAIHLTDAVHGKFMRKEVKSSLESSYKSKEFSRKKGISICSKSIGKNTSLSKKRPTDTQTIDSREFMKDLPKKIKPYSVQKNDKVRRVATQQSKSRKILNNCYVNENIGRKQKNHHAQ